MLQKTSRLTWGILGTGRIAAQFAVGLNSSDRNSLVAVGSRNLDTAKAFAATHKIPALHASYDALLADPAIQAVYVSLPNSMHHEWTLKSLRAGKHVLCEKPLATNLAQAEEMFDVAKKEGRVLAEGFMYLSHPLTHAVQKAVADGLIGELRMIRTSFLFTAAKVTGSIKFNTDLAGGALMDVGCYCLTYARLFANAEPTNLAAFAHLHESGVDDYTVAALAFPKNILSNFACGMLLSASNVATLHGTKAHLEIPIPWKPPVKDAEYSLVSPTGERQTSHVSVNKDLYAVEADDFASTILDGTPQRVTREFSLGNQKCLDILRKQIGLPY